MTWRWLDVVAERPKDAEGAAPIRDEQDEPAGFLAWWPKSAEHRPGRALRVDERLVAGGGVATWVSWCRFPEADGDSSFAFDDGAVTGALRRRLSDPWPEAVSTLLVDWSRIAGEIASATTRRSAAADPFARVFPDHRLFRIEAGALGAIPAPTGPAVTRYGSGNPWPWDRYAGQVQ